MMQTSEMFKKIKSLFIVEEAGGASSNSESPSSGQTTVVTSGSNQNSSPTPQHTEPGNIKPDSKFTDLLLKAIESNNMEGFDYLEYKNSLRSVANVIPDESMRYKSAFEMAKTMGLSKEKLIQSANQYLNILVNEDKKFKEALENQKSKQIQGRSDQLASIEKSIVEKQQLIEKMKKEIETSTQQLDTIKNEINDAVVKIDVTNQQFVASYNLVYNQIYSDIEKIKANL
jgi:hypothetical protein